MKGLLAKSYSGDDAVRKYEIIIFWSAEVPELRLPGCMAHGDTPECADQRTGGD